MLPPIFYDFAFITLAAWLVGAGVWFFGRRFSWRLPPRAVDAAFYGALALFVATFAVLAVLRHQALNSHTYDLGIYDQVVWNLSRGRWFATSLEYYFYNFLGDHLSLALTFLAPLYWLYPNANVLVALQPVAMGLAGVPVYWWAREKTGPAPALALGLAYLLYTPMVYVIAIDFHDIVLAAPLLSFAVFYTLKGNAWRFAVFAFPALLVKEEVGLFVAMLGLYWMLSQRRWRLGAGTVVMGMAWVLVATKLVIPSFNPDGQYYYLGRYASLGASHEELALNLILKPSQTLASMITPEKVRYVLHLLTPLGFLPLFGPGLLAVALPALGYLLLREESPSFLIITQYAAPMAPFLFFATVRAISRARSQHLAAALAVVVLVAVGASYYLHSPGPLSRNFAPQRYSVSPRAATGKELLDRIPPQAGVVAQSDLVPHLSRRELVHMFPEVPSYEGIEYVLLDQEGNRYPLSGSDEAYQRAVAEVLANPRFRLVEEREGYLLLRRTAEEPVPLEANLDGKARLYGYQIAAAPDPAGDSLLLSLYWETLSPMAQDYSLFIHLVDDQGRRLAQWDGPPLGQYLPTSRWRPGTRLRGEYRVPVPPGVTLSDKRLVLGLYDWQTLERLPVISQAGRPQEDSIVIKMSF